MLLLSLLMIWRLQWSRGSLPGCNRSSILTKHLDIWLQWGRGSLPGCDDRFPVNTSRTQGFNGAGDHSPDVTAAKHGHGRQHHGFNGAGDHSPDVTGSFPASSIWCILLQWGRGSLPGCDRCKTRPRAPTSWLQWGRGSLPGCDDGRNGRHASRHGASMGPGITPRM